MGEDKSLETLAVKSLQIFLGAQRYKLSGRVIEMGEQGSHGHSWLTESWR